MKVYLRQSSELHCPWAKGTASGKTRYIRKCTALVQKAQLLAKQGTFGNALP